LGWSVGGMMSYGIVIGYCKGDDFGNVLYGYTMLGVIGALYGVIGGGFLGLGLETTDEKRPDWARLLTEMVAGAMLIWGILIYQLEWFMTPPRSELWAACLGAALAMLWYMKRSGFEKALRVALFTASGAGFGFIAGNFIQGLGAASEISYNWWNVMEFVLGLCGGLAMAYAVVTTPWPETRRPSRSVQHLSLGFLFIGIPLTNFVASYTKAKLTDVAERLAIANPDMYATYHLCFGSITLAIAAALAFYTWRRKSDKRYFRPAVILLLTTTVSYLILGMLLKGYFAELPRINNSVTAYVPILLLALYLLLSHGNMTTNGNSFGQKIRLKYICLGILAATVVIALISVSINPTLENVNRRY